VLFHNGLLVLAAEEERFSGVKHAPGALPIGAAKWCLSEFGVGAEALDAIAVGHNPIHWPGRFRCQIEKAQDDLGELLAAVRANLAGPTESITFLRNLIERLDGAALQTESWLDEEEASRRLLSEAGLNDFPGRVAFVGHHMAHAASAYYQSGFDTVIAFVMDGVGDSICSSVWSFSDARQELLFAEEYPNSLGYFYAAITDFLGFGAFGGEGTLMAAAPLGSSNDAVSKRLPLIADFSPRSYHVSRFIRRCTGKGLALNLDKSRIYLAEIFGVKPRTENEELTSVYLDIAYEAQKYFQQSITQFVTRALENIEGYDALVFSGGCFLNCKSNGNLRDILSRTPTFFDPLASDAGVALGAAYMTQAQVGLIKHDRRMPGTLYVGPHPFKTGGSKSWRGSRIKIGDGTLSGLAKALADGATVICFRGRMEFGPRALGNRSILASAMYPEMRERLNRIKGRASWRPFGASILSEFFDEVVDLGGNSNSSSFMIETFKVKSACFFV
jgi:carbamoyltransferase